MATTKDMKWVETTEHAAAFEGEPEDGTEVRVYRKSRGGSWVPMGAGRLAQGLILGSGVNCGVLAHLEREISRSRAG